MCENQKTVMTQKRPKIASWKARQKRGLSYFYYRSRIFFVSLILAFVPTYFTPLWNIGGVFLGSFMSFVVMGDILIYKILRRKESQKISAETLIKWDGLTPDQLDSFIRKMVNIRLITYIIGSVGLCFTGFSFQTLDKWVFFMWILRLIITFYLINKKALKIPLSYPTALSGSHYRPVKHRPMSSSARHPIYTTDNVRYATTGFLTTTKY